MDEQHAQQKTECDDKRMEVHAKPWTQDLDDGRTPVLVFCVNASRIGTDIESALKGVNDHRPVLIVLHCKKPSSLRRGDLSDDDYLLDQALRDRVTGIAHFAFSEFGGFYLCRQNDDGFRKLSDLLSKVSKYLLIKRCDKDNPRVRNVEGEIIRRMKQQKLADSEDFFGWLWRKTIGIPSSKSKSSKQDNTGFKNDFLIKRCEQDNPGVRNVENEIIRRMDVRGKTWTQDLDDGRTPVLVFCVNASQIGTDIESALREVNDHRPVLVVLHCKKPSSLRGDLSDDDYLLDQALSDRVTGIARFVFSESDGFYSCRQNDDGFRKLSGLLSIVTECKHSDLLTKAVDKTISRPHQLGDVDTRSRLEIEQQAHECTRYLLSEAESTTIVTLYKTLEGIQGTLAGEQQTHEYARSNLKLEQQAHEDTRRRLEAEKQDTRSSLEAEQQAHEDTRRRLEAEKQDTRSSLEAEQQAHEFKKCFFPP